MPKISSRSTTAGPLLAKREPFTTHGALKAVACAPQNIGRLCGQWAERYRADIEDPGVIYAVTSYATPIGWVRADGEVIIPDEGYSVTTSRHQTIVRAWL